MFPAVEISSLSLVLGEFACCCGFFFCVKESAGPVREACALRCAFRTRLAAGVCAPAPKNDSRDSSAGSHRRRWAFHITTAVWELQFHGRSTTALK